MLVEVMYGLPLAHDELYASFKLFGTTFSPKRLQVRLWDAEPKAVARHFGLSVHTLLESYVNTLAIMEESFDHFTQNTRIFHDRYDRDPHDILEFGLYKLK